MKKEYMITRETKRNNRLRLVALLLIAIGAPIATFAFSIKRYPDSAYIWINLLLVTVAVFCLNVKANFGDQRSGKGIKAKNRKKYLIATSVIAIIIWIALIILKATRIGATFIFVADIVFSVQMWIVLWHMFDNMDTRRVDKFQEGKYPTAFPGEIVLHDVRTFDAWGSPYGKVLMEKNAVLFVLPNLEEGFVMVNPNGTMSLKKNSFGNEIKDCDLSVDLLMEQAREGVKRVMEIVKEGCEKNGIPEPAFIYDFVLYMPSFEPGNTVWDPQSFSQQRSVHFWNEEKKYKEYLETARQADYFEGKACFKAQELRLALNILAAANEGETVTSETRDMVAEWIAQACGLAKT